GLGGELGVEVDDAGAVGEEGVEDVVGIVDERAADDLVVVVDPIGVAVVPAERAQVGHRTVGVDEGVIDAVAGGGVAGDAVVVVDREPRASAAAQVAEGDAADAVVEEAVGGAGIAGVGFAGDLAGAVDGVGVSAVDV